MYLKFKLMFSQEFKENVNNFDKQVNWFLIVLIKNVLIYSRLINHITYLRFYLFNTKVVKKNKKQKNNENILQVVCVVFISSFFVSLGSSYLTGCDEAI